MLPQYTQGKIIVAGSIKLYRHFTQTNCNFEIFMTAAILVIKSIYFQNHNKSKHSITIQDELDGSPTKRSRFSGKQPLESASAFSSRANVQASNLDTPFAQSAPTTPLTRDIDRLVHTIQCFLIYTRPPSLSKHVFNFK